MLLKKFKYNDIFYNTLKTYPKQDFWFYEDRVFLNSKPEMTGSLSSTDILHVPTGHVSLYELNVDRPSGQLIYPFIVKESSLSAFKTVTTSNYNSGYNYGDTITGSYPLSATIEQEYFAAGAARAEVDALKNTLEFYRPLNSAFADSSFYNDNLRYIPIPSIFFGSQIRKGSINLKFYHTGTLVGELKDENRDGTLIQIGPNGSNGSGSVAGVTLYNEGFILLTGSWNLDGASTAWTNWGTNNASYAYNLSFEGTHKIPTLTMLAHAKQGEMNHSNNPTFITFGEVTASASTGSTHYIERDNIQIKNTVKIPYDDPTGSFKKQTWISKIGIYDKDRNLIGIAKLARPVRKREEDGFTFKLKIDI